MIDQQYTYDEAILVRNALMSAVLRASNAIERVPDEWTAYIEAKNAEYHTALLLFDKLSKGIAAYENDHNLPPWHERGLNERRSKPS